jgi:hypothetical protein
MSIKTRKLSPLHWVARAIDMLLAPVPRRRLMLGAIDLGAPEVKAAITAAVEEATAPLLAKRDELLTEVKKARKGQQIDPEAVSKLEDQIETLKGELSTAQKAAKTATADADKARKALESESGFVQKLLIDNAMTKAGVKEAVHLKAAKAMLAGQAQIVIDGDARVAKVGDKPVADFVSEWAKGDEGKFFVAAPQNQGGGSQGGQGGGAAKTMTRSAFEALDAASKLAHSKAGGVLTD